MHEPAQPALAGWALAEARDKKVKGNLIKNLKCCAEAIPIYLPRMPSVACYTVINNPNREALWQTPYLLL